MSDAELIREFIKTQSQSAFAEIVTRYVDMVYAAAQRQIGDRQLAEDVVQGVFLALSEKLPALGPDTALGPWLYTATRFACVNMLRKRARQKRSEMKASHMSTDVPDPAVHLQWLAVAPMLDEAMASLSETDRSVIVMRFFEQRQLKDIGAQIGTGESGAEKRVTRALEKLRNLFTRRGVELSALGIAALISNQAVQAAPQGLATSVVEAFATYQAGFHVTSGNLIAKGLLKTMFIAKSVKAAAFAAVFLLLGGTVTAVVQRIAAPQNDGKAEAAALAAKVEALESQLEDLKNQAQAAAIESAQARQPVRVPVGIPADPGFADAAAIVGPPAPALPPAAAVGGPAPKAAPLDQRLVLHLPMAGDLLDHGPNKYSVKNAGNVAAGPNSASFNGASWLELPFIPLNQHDFAVAMWIKPAANSATGYGLVTQNDSNIQSMMLHLILGPEMEPHLSFYENHLKSSAQYAIQPGAWTHLVFQYFDKKQHIYMNGKLIAERWGGPYEATHGATLIGRPPQWFDHPIANFTGSMSDLRIYDARLSAAQMQTLAQQVPTKDEAAGVEKGKNDAF